MSSVQNADMKLEVVGIPVSDVERAAQFNPEARLEAGRGHRAGGRPASPVHAARLSVLGPHRQGRRPGAPGNDPVRPPRRLRHRGGARGSGSARESTPARSSTTPPAATTASTRMARARRPQSPAEELRVVPALQRPGREWLAAPGDHHEVSRSRRFEHDIVRLRGRPGERDATGGGRPRRAREARRWAGPELARLVRRVHGRGAEREGTPRVGRRGAGAPGECFATKYPLTGI